jgi:hypothetical protein
LADLAANAFLAFLIFVAFLLVILVNRIAVKEFNCHPNYLFEYLLRMVCPNVLALAMLLLYVYRHPKLRSNLMQTFANILNFDL